MDLSEVSVKARKGYDDANCTYNGGSYYIHVGMVEDVMALNNGIFLLYEDYINARGACSCHDLVEDAKFSFNDVKDMSNHEVAKIVLAVTDVPEENRLLRIIATMPKTIKDYRAIIVKMCDIHANASYSKANGSSMYKKYCAEYEFRRPIFKMALKWYGEYLDEEYLSKLWLELDEIHEYYK